MEQNRVRIADIAEALGISTATVSNVIHGKTAKISDATVKRVEQELEKTGYIPNMAGILLARNNSRIIGVVMNDHVKYEGRVLEDGFVMSSLNALSREANEKGYFLMIKTTADIREIPVFASMWNMDGLILMGFCEADYEALRSQTRISFVVYDGYFAACSKVVNLTIGHYDGGYQADSMQGNWDTQRRCALPTTTFAWTKSAWMAFALPLRRAKPCFGRSLRCKKNAVLIMRSIFAVS